MVGRVVSALFHKHIIMIHNYKSFLKRILPWVMLFYIISVLLVTFVIFLRLAGALLPMEELFLTVQEALIYAQLVLMFNLVDWAIGMTGLAVIIVWPIFGFLVWLLIGLVTEGPYQLMARQSQSFLRRNSRYDLFFGRILRKRLLVLEIAILGIIGVLLVKWNLGERSIREIVSFFGTAVLLCVPAVFGFIWFHYLFIRKRRRERKKTDSLDNYLFSKESIRYTFKSVIDMLVFLAVLGWILLPLLFGSMERLENKGTQFLIDKIDYRSKWDSLVDEDRFSKTDIEGIIRSLPEPNRLKESLSWIPIPALGGYTAVRNALPQFQQKMFLVLTLAGLCSLGIPSVLNVIVYGGRAKAVKSIFLAVVKSTLLTLAIRFFIGKAYFVDVSGITGISTVFFFIISFFLMEQSTQMGK